MNPIKLYAKSQEVQLNWIRKHPVQYVVLNVAVAAVFIAYIEIKDRREMAKWNKENNLPEETA